MILTKDDFDRECRWMFLHCKDPAAAKAEILAIFSEEPGNEHQWEDQDIYEQMIKIICKVTIQNDKKLYTCTKEILKHRIAGLQMKKG